jgi:hypothetical protein
MSMPRARATRAMFGVFGPVLGLASSEENVQNSSSAIHERDVLPA